ncbi:MAG: sensor signal transduction histidine kinase [Candidatus Acidoferrum typicum]|nr:sensor signal transduction histidine kinase [Candidatus Acidoferrum typicum]
MESTAEIKRLQSCINDLISVLALPAIWSGSESSQILGTLLDVLLTMLRLDFAYARLGDASDGPPIEVVRLTGQRHSSVQPQQFGRALDRWLTGDQIASGCAVPYPGGEGEVSIASFSLGLQHESGVFVAGSRRADFPTEVEGPLLRVAVNQAGIGLQEARRSGEQKRVAEMLEQRVAERTRRLTAVNEELRRSEAYLSEAQRLSHTGSFGWRPSTGELIWSEETFRIYQYDRTIRPRVELVLQRVHPEDAALVKQTIERASQDGKDFDFEYRLLMPDSSLVKHVQVVAHALSDDSGSIEFVGAVMDVTEQHQARAALETALDEIKKSQDRLRLVIDTIPAHVWSALADGSVDFINQRALESFGLSIEDDRGWGWGSTVHPDDLERFVGAWHAALAAGEPMESEARLRRADGEYRWWLIRNVPLRDELGNIIKWYGTAIEIEDRKRAEETLRRSESYLAEAQRLTHTGSWVWRVAGRCAVHLSEEWYRIYGFDPEEGMPGWEERLQRIHPEDRGKWQGAIDRAISEKSDYEKEFRILLPDGTIKHIRTVGHPVLNASGDLVQFVGSSMDITASKRAEEAQADLAHISRVTTMGELTASLAHEVNQPIAAAVTDASTCLRWLNRDHPDVEEAREAAARIVKDATRAAQIIGRTRMLFKKGTPQWDLVDINEIIREMVSLMRSEVTQHSISVRTELAENIPQITGDRVQLQQVFMNLMINAIDAMKDMDGTRDLTISSLRAENEQLMVSISDTGVGIPPQQADQIFNAFFTTKPHGTGMGLRISRSIVESHGGRLWAAANSPHGASFHLTLPTKVEARE